MDSLEDQLRELVVETCAYPLNSIQRQQGLTQLIRLIAQSGKLWQEQTPYYEDALQQTWLYFCRNLCQGTTGKAYDAEQGSVITWLNAYLKWRLKDYYLQAQAELSMTVSERRSDSSSSSPMVETLVAPPDVPSLLDKVTAWAQSDPQGELSRTHIQGHPEVNCQTLILRRLPPETSWKQLSIELSLSISTLSSFYQRQCLPRLRKFGESERYL